VSVSNFVVGRRAVFSASPFEEVLTVVQFKGWGHCHEYHIGREWERQHKGVDDILL
jgi:hypothetical protein